MSLVHGSATSIAIATLAAGRHDVTAAYSGGTGFAASTSATLSQVVGRATLTVAAAPASKTYGDPGPALTYTLSGFVNGDDASVVAGTAALGLIDAGSHAVANDKFTPAGSDAITVGLGSLSAANYDFGTLVPSTLTVAKAHILVKADDLDMAHFDRPPTPTYTVTGFVNGEGPSALLAPSLPALDPGASAGLYPIPISIGTLSAANYDFPALVAGTLTVHPKVLDVRVHWGTQSMSLLNLRRDLPFVDITAFDVLFSDPVAVGLADLTLRSTVPGGAAYRFGGFSYDAKARDATWTLPSALGVDRLMLALGGGVGTAAAGGQVIPLSGATRWGLDVLPGDVSGDGQVDVNDLSTVLAPFAAGRYDLFADVDGDGKILAADYQQVRRRLGSKLP